MKTIDEISQKVDTLHAPNQELLFASAEDAALFEKAMSHEDATEIEGSVQESREESRAESREESLAFGRHDVQEPERRDAGTREPGNIEPGNIGSSAQGREAENKVSLQKSGVESRAESLAFGRNYVQEPRERVADKSDAGTREPGNIGSSAQGRETVGAESLTVNQGERLGTTETEMVGVLTKIVQDQAPTAPYSQCQVTLPSAEGAPIELNLARTATGTLDVQITSADAGVRDLVGELQSSLRAVGEDARITCHVTPANDGLQTPLPRTEEDPSAVSPEESSPTSVLHEAFTKLQKRHARMNTREQVFAQQKVVEGLREHVIPQQNVVETPKADVQNVRHDTPLSVASVERLVERILVSEPNAGRQEVRLTLDQSTLPGTEVSITRDIDNHLSVRIVCSNNNSFQTVLEARQQLADRLNGAQITVENTSFESDAGGERRGRSQTYQDYDPEQG